MKPIKKLFLGITTVAFFLTSAVFSNINNVFESAGAEDNLVYTPINRPTTDYEELSLTDAEGMPGDTVRIYLNVSAEDNLESMDVVLGWNDTNLICANAEGIDAFGSRVVSNIYDGFLSVCVYSTLAIADGHVAAIDFTIPQDAKPGTVYNIDYVRLDTVATLDEDITDTVGVSGGTITVPKTERLSETELNLNVGETHALKVTEYTGEISWISDDTGVAVVRDGLVTAVNKGTAVIYAVIGNKVLICRVNVTGEAVTSSTTQPQIQTGVSVSSSVTAVSSSITDFTQSSVTSVSQTATESSETSVSDTAAVTSSTETTEITRSGTTETTVTTETTESTETAISITTAETSLTFSETNILTGTVSSSESTVSVTSQSGSESSTKTKVTMYVGDKLLLRVKGYDGEVKWVSSDENVVVVDSKGNIEAVGKGSSTILALYENRYLICEVEVLEKKMYSSGVRGDADGNGTVNIRDAAVIAKKISMGEGAQLPDCADYNQDGTANIRDAAAIARAISRKYSINIHIVIKR